MLFCAIFPNMPRPRRARCRPISSPICRKLFIGNTLLSICRESVRIGRFLKRPRLWGAEWERCAGPNSDATGRDFGGWICRWRETPSFRRATESAMWMRAASCRAGMWKGWRSPRAFFSWKWRHLRKILHRFLRRGRFSIATATKYSTKPYRRLHFRGLWPCTVCSMPRKDVFIGVMKTATR